MNILRLNVRLAADRYFGIFDVADGLETVERTASK